METDNCKSLKSSTCCLKTNEESLSKHCNWSRFSEWIHCMCVVTFDLELGQAIEVIYPEKFGLSEQEKTNICYLAFPDSNSGCMGDTQFHVRLRLAPDTSDRQENQKNTLSFHHKCFNSQCLTVQKADKAHYWGFVYFRQRKEASLPRGYLQKSFIILTRLPFINLFYEILSELAPKYFHDGFNVVELACNQICNWPPLRAGEHHYLPLFNTAYQAFIPQGNSKSSCNSNGAASKGNPEYTKSQNLHNATYSPQLKILTSVNEIDLFRSVSSVVSHIYTLWELVLTAEPIVVIGPSPTDTSYMVQSLVSLIAPLEYCAESRPYFTIHDSEFKEFTREYGHFTVPPSIIIGVTNPYFVKLLKDWPHMIRITTNDSQVQQTPIASLNNSSSPKGNIGPIIDISNSNKRLITSDNPTGVITKYKPYLKKDKTLIKKILLGIETKRPEHVQSALLRRSLLELTQSFMIPLERYIASLMPLQKDISPFKSAPSPNQFKQDDFLNTLEQSGPQLTSTLKGNWRGLYKRFFKSPNFKGWFETRYQELEQTLQILQLQALTEADLNQWAQGKQEVEIVDMIIKLKQKLSLCASQDSHTNVVVNDTRQTNTTISNSQFDEIRQQLLRQIDCMKHSLPDDLKSILFNM